MAILPCIKTPTLMYSFLFFFLAEPPGEPGTPAVEAQSLTHWTTREVPTLMFLRLFLTSYGGGRKFSREVPSPYLVGRFTETARVTQSNSSQIPLTTIEQNLSQVLSSEESTESH